MQGIHKNSGDRRYHPDHNSDQIIARGDGSDVLEVCVAKLAEQSRELQRIQHTAKDLLMIGKTEEKKGRADQPDQKG